MDVGIRMRILIWVGVLNHAAERLRFQHDPRAFSFLKVVSDLHAGAGRPTRLWSKLNFRMSLVPVDRRLRTFMSMALIFKVPMAFRCCMMPERMAALSLDCLLHAPGPRSPPASSRTKTRRFMLFMLVSSSTPRAASEVFGGRFRGPSLPLFFLRFYSPCRGPGRCG